MSLAKKNSGHMPVIAKRDSLMLYWIKPESNADLIDFYELYYRTDTNSAWVLLEKDIPVADTPRIIIRRSQLPGDKTEYYFAVRSGAKSGARSGYIMSTDPMPLVKEGWYVVWKNK